MAVEEQDDLCHCTCRVSLELVGSDPTMGLPPLSIANQFQTVFHTIILNIDKLFVDIGAFNVEN